MALKKHKVVGPVLIDHYNEKSTDKILNTLSSLRFYKFCFEENKVMGLDNLVNYIHENNETCLCYFSNHMSLVDYMRFRRITHRVGLKGKRAARPLAGKNLYVWPVSVLWKKAGGLKFDRKNPRQSYSVRVLRELTNFLKKGTDLLIYPQGKRVQSKEFKPESAFFSLPVNAYLQGQENLAVVPIYVDYDNPVEDKVGLKISHKLKFLGKIRHLVDVYMFFKRIIFDGPIGSSYFAFGEPIHLKDVVNGNKRESKNNLVKIIKCEIEKLRDETLKHKRTNGYRKARDDYSSYSSSAILKIS